MCLGGRGQAGPSHPTPLKPSQTRPSHSTTRTARSHGTDSDACWRLFRQHIYAGPSLVPTPAQTMQAIFRTAPLRSAPSLLRKLSTKRVRFACSSQAKPKPAELSQTHQNQTIFTTAPFALALYALYMYQDSVRCVLSGSDTASRERYNSTSLVTIMCAGRLSW